MEGIAAAFGASPWGPLALAFLFGFAFGWVIWGYRRSSQNAAHEFDGGATEPKELVVIKAELQAARALLEKEEESADDMSIQLAALDEAVNTIASRLSSVMSAAKRAPRRSA